MEVKYSTVTLFSSRPLTRTGFLSTHQLPFHFVNLANAPSIPPTHPGRCFSLPVNPFLFCKPWQRPFHPSHLPEHVGALPVSSLSIVESRQHPFRLEFTPPLFFSSIQYLDIRGRLIISTSQSEVFSRDTAVSTCSCYVLSCFLQLQLSQGLGRKCTLLLVK